LINASAFSVVQEDSLFVEPFGKVFIYRKTPNPENLVILISGDGGWKYGVVDFAKKFSEKNAVIAGVDILRYFRELRRSHVECYNVSEDFKLLSKAVTEKYSIPSKSAVLMGYSSGATLVYGILAQSSPGSFLGGISLGFCPDLELPKELCRMNGLDEKADSALKSIFLLPHPAFPL
jgi:type IV secretory pathway VirJ component